MTEAGTSSVVGYRQKCPSFSVLDCVSAGLLGGKMEGENWEVDNRDDPVGEG